MTLRPFRIGVLALGGLVELGCTATLPRSGLACPSGAFVKTANDHERGSREWCEIPSYQKDCSVYGGSCEVPGTSHGPWVHYDAQGRRDELSNVDHGSISGTRMSWWPNGGPKLRNEWVANQRVGRETRWHENGAVAWQGFYAGGRREGAWAGWFADAKPAWSGAYHAGVPIGEWAFWNPDGSVSRVDRFELEPTTFDTSGGSCAQGTTVSGTPGHSLSCILERPSGALAHGISASWDANGHLVDHASHWLGQRHGRHVTWNAYTGAPLRLETHAHGVPIGTWLVFDENGVLQRAETYAQGVVGSTWERPM